jgi:hypothetical protein
MSMCCEGGWTPAGLPTRSFPLQHRLHHGTRHSAPPLSTPLQVSASTASDPSSATLALKKLEVGPHVHVLL